MPVSYREILQRLLPPEILTEEEAADVSRALSSPSPIEVRETALRIVRNLIARGQLEVLERTAEGTGHRVRLREPTSGVRISLRMEAPPGAEGFELISLPLEPGQTSSIRPGLVRQLLFEQGAVVLADRVAGPREIVQRMEPTMRAALEADSVRFFPIDAPPGEFWRSVEASELPLPEARLRELARARAQVIHIPDFSRLDPSFGALHRSGSGIYIGIGEEAGGWRAVLEIRDVHADTFDRERIGMAVLLATHFQTILASTVRLQSLIFFDFLTGLYNRPYFEDQLEKQVSVAQRRDQGLALCIIDIDNFKNFNTLYGYEGGDRVLVTVGCVLKAALRGSDTLARYGGEEFAALLSPPVTWEEAHVIAERLRAAVETEPFQVQNLGGAYVSERITVSIGGSLFPHHGQGVREIWTSANRMLIEAKQLGKNRVRFPGDPTPRASAR